MADESNKIASLEPTTDAEASQAPQSSGKDEAYARTEAARYIKRGMDQQKVAAKLVKAGVERPVAIRITLEVWEEQGATRRTNALILLMTGGVFWAIALIWVVPVALRAGIPPFSGAYLLLIAGSWLVYRGVQDYRGVQKPSESADL